MNKSIFILFFALLLVLTGCAAEQNPKDPWCLNMVTSMSGTPDDYTVQELEYDIDISYIGSNNIEMVGVEPVLSEKPEVKARIIDQSHRIVEQKSTSMLVKGKIMISTGELTKKQIEATGPFITGLKISWKEDGKVQATIKNLN